MLAPSRGDGVLVFAICGLDGLVALGVGWPVVRASGCCNRSNASLAASWSGSLGSDLTTSDVAGTACTLLPLPDVGSPVPLVSVRTIFVGIGRRWRFAEMTLFVTLFKPGTVLSPIPLLLIPADDAELPLRTAKLRPPQSHNLGDSPLGTADPPVGADARDRPDNLANIAAPLHGLRGEHVLPGAAHLAG